MPSKGVDYYSYISVPNGTIQFIGPKVGSTTISANNFQKNHVEIDYSNLSRTIAITGRFEWKASVGSTLIADKYNDISPLTGNLDGGNMSEIMSTPMVVTPSYIVSYGFYDSGSGAASLTTGLTNADQCWVCLTKNQSNWMGNSAPSGSTNATRVPFSAWALPGAHDAGMNTMQNIKYFTDGLAGVAVRATLALILPLPAPAKVYFTANANNIILGLAITQKDSITNMLSLGVRYFDFRPAYPHDKLKPFCSSGMYTLYHTHDLIPGISYAEFLHEVVAFLSANPTEVVVVRIASDGISSDCPLPNKATLDSFAQTAIQGANVKVGDNSCFKLPIDKIRANGTRLIILQGDAKYDSYEDAAYATLTPTTIINCFSKMNSQGQTSCDLTVLQCQGTATNINAVLAYAIAFANSSTSPLMETKARFDSQTLPWIQTNVMQKFNNSELYNLMIILNDFVDGATVDQTIQLNDKRLAASLNRGQRLR